MDALAYLVWLLALPLAVLAAWQFAGVILSIEAIRRSKASFSGSQETSAEHVAIICPTCDDFSAKACDSLLWQVGVTTSVFVLDDSEVPDRRAEIDAWSTAHPEVRIVRRGDRAGFKAGNINHWLRECGGAQQFSFALLVDADEIVPPNFTLALLRAIERTGAAFVQGCHEVRPAATPFQALLGLHVSTVWRFTTPARNLTGLPWMLGHGVLFRTAAIDAAGGFPEIVSEDLALTIALAERGQFGVVVPEAIAWEDFPATCGIYWRRLQRWVAADAEIARTFLPRLWRSSLPIVPKLDLSLRELRLPFLVCGWLIPVALAALALAGSGSTIHLPVLCWLVLIPLLLPHTAVWMLPRGDISQRAAHSFCMPFLGLAGLGLYVPAVIEGWSGKCKFNSTGSRSADEGMPAMTACESVAGLLVVTSGFWSSNFALAAMGIALVLACKVRKAKSIGLLITGATLFWFLIIFQMVSDAATGYVPIEHLLPLVAIGAATD